MTQLTLIETPYQPDLVTLALTAVRRRRQACVERYGRGVRLVDHPRRLHLQVFRGRTLLAQALRPVQDAYPPGALDNIGWLLRTARAWHTMAMAPEKGKSVRLSFEKLEEELATAEADETFTLRGKQLRLVVA